MSLLLRSYMEPSGQRNAVLVDSETGLPEYWPMLYATSVLRAKGMAFNTKKLHLQAINYLYLWSDMRGIDIESRITAVKGFSRNEIDTLVTLVRSRISDIKNEKANNPNEVNVVKLRMRTQDIWGALEDQPRQIGAKAYNDRLTYVSRYIEWLSDYLSDQTGFADDDYRESVSKIGVDFKAVLHSYLSVEPSTAFSKPKALGASDTRKLLETVMPNSEANPWDGYATQIRNFAIIYVLLDTGLRSGELLSLKLKDIIWDKKGSKGLKVRRRQGDKNDPRIHQRCSKGREREVPLSEGAFKALDLYVTQVRNAIPQARNTDYLFVSLSNRNIGAPLNAIGPITDDVRDLLGIDLVPHILRHSATWGYCMTQKKLGRTWEETLEMLVYKFGWASDKSPSLRYYARQFIKDQVFESAIREQDALNRDMEEALETIRLEFLDD